MSMPEAAGAAGPRRAAAGMLVVRREQMQLFRDLLTQDFRLRLERQLRRVHSARMQDLGAASLGGSPEEFARLVASETARWGEVVRRLGLKAD